MNGNEDIIRNFGMANTLAEVSLDSVEQDYNLNLGRTLSEDSKDERYYQQFEEAIRKEARNMARYYEIFYCLERSVRSLIKDRLKELDENWWESRIPKQTQDEALGRHKQEENRGITPRSGDLLDYTNFGELNGIINHNWDDAFSDMFTNQDAVRNVMTMLNTLRGPIAHCGYLAEDEVLRLHMSLRDWFRLME